MLYSLARLLVCYYVLGMLAIGEVKNESTVVYSGKSKAKQNKKSNNNNGCSQKKENAY